MAAAKFRIDGAAPDCADPMGVQWQAMVPADVALSGRVIRQGRWRVTLTWENMADADVGALGAIWKSKVAAGYRLTSAVVPPFLGPDNANWPTVDGGVGGFIQWKDPPVHTRAVLEGRNVQIVFEDVALPVES